MKPLLLPSFALRLLLFVLAMLPSWAMADAPTIRLEHLDGTPVVDGEVFVVKYYTYALGYDDKDGNDRLVIRNIGSVPTPRFQYQGDDPQGTGIQAQFIRFYSIAPGATGLASLHKWYTDRLDLDFDQTSTIFIPEAGLSIKVRLVGKAVPDATIDESLFPETRQGTSSTTKVKINNVNGAAPMIVTGVTCRSGYPASSSLSSANISAVDALPWEVPAGQTKEFTLKYTPSKEENLSCYLHWQHNGLREVISYTQVIGYVPFQLLHPGGTPVENDEIFTISAEFYSNGQEWIPEIPVKVKNLGSSRLTSVGASAYVDGSVDSVNLGVAGSVDPGNTAAAAITFRQRPPIDGSDPERTFDRLYVMDLPHAGISIRVRVVARLAP